MAKEKENLKNDTLDETLKQIEKLYGKGAVMRLGDRETVDFDDSTFWITTDTDGLVNE